MTIEERIKRIEGRLDKAEGGKWTVRGSTVACGEFGVIASNGRGGNVREFVEQGNRNMEFIAHSKDDITFLLSELKRCREALEKFGFHKPECERYVYDGWTTTENGTKFTLLSEDKNCDCTCGFTQALHPEGVK